MGCYNAIGSVSLVLGSITKMVKYSGILDWARCCHESWGDTNRVVTDIGDGRWWFQAKPILKEDFFFFFKYIEQLSF